MEISYRIGERLDLDQVIDLYVASTLGQRRPVDSRDRMQSMLDNANLVVTAWDESGQRPLLVGISRSLSDFRYVTYLADLAVRTTHQRRGIGAELVRRTKDAAPEAYIVLLAAPQAVDYYPRIGFKRHESAWLLRAGEELIIPGGSC